MENQPVYEEFGSVLLLVSTIKHRFKLQPSEVNGVDPDSFTSRYFRLASESRTTDQLSEHENDLLGGWVRGLFEAEGINDELMSTCKPAEFYLLIATLFDQSIKACQSRTLTMETLKGGFECTSFSSSTLVHAVCCLLFFLFSIPLSSWRSIESHRDRQIFWNLSFFPPSLQASPGSPTLSGPFPLPPR